MQPQGSKALKPEEFFPLEMDKEVEKSTKNAELSFNAFAAAFNKAYKLK